MKKSQSYYFEDVAFQLELNLQEIRRDLVQLLEEYMFNDCFTCNRIKCCCSSESSFQSTTISIMSSDSACEMRDHSFDAYYNAAPPPETLPTPKWPEKKTSNVHPTNATEPKPKISVTAINIWIKASIPNVIQSNTRVNFPVPSKVLDHVNYSWPPFPKSIWSDERLKETTEREDKLLRESEGDGNSSVDAFFRYFSGNRTIPKTAFAC